MMYLYFVAIAHRVQHKVLENKVNMEILHFQNMYIQSN